MLFSQVILPLLQASLVLAQGVEQRDQMEEMEHLLVDNFGTNSNGFIAAVSPCLNYFGFASDPKDRGEQTSAQWVRFGFHDFVTADLGAGTGGLDASLGFESDRAENLGLFVNDTLQFMVPTVSAYLSMSDNTALGVVASVATCGGSKTAIPLKVGRIDAQEAGPSGVPGPTTDIETTLSQFASAGFDQSDTIALTACGHSLGNIHYSNFPDIGTCIKRSIPFYCMANVISTVPSSAVTPTNLDGADSFDSTPGVFDPAVVTEYLSSTGKKGGLLVTGPNVDEHSDFRLYNSDLNITLESMTTLQAFGLRCSSLFSRMIDTVPRSVTLSSPVTPLTWKAVNVALDISSAGEVSISGLIRNLYTDIDPPSTVSYTTSGSSGISAIHTSSEASGTGSSLYGNTTYWPITATLSSPGTTSLNFETVTYPVNDNIFVLPSQSSVSGSTITVKGAALTSLGSGMTGTVYVQQSMEGTISPKIVPTTVKMSSSGSAGKYTLYEGILSVPGKQDVVVKVTVGGNDSRAVKSDIFSG